MKVKLLKKARKRFEIVHMPTGFTQFGDRYEYNLYRLTDSQNEFYDRYAQLGRVDKPTQFQKDEYIFETEKECLEYLKRCIINRLRSEGHIGRKDRIMKEKHNKVWYK